jgi:hypothetical protein
MIGGAELLKGKVRIIWCNLLVKFKERGKKQRQAGLTVANFFLFFFVGLELCCVKTSKQLFLVSFAKDGLL